LLLDGFIKGFKGIPNVVVGAASAVNRGCDAMIDFFMAAPDMAFNAIKNGFNSIKNGFINFIPNCKKAINAIKTLNITMSLNPVGLVVGAFAVGAFMIYKYWQPISAFFKGMFIGIKQGLAPLQPTFIAIGNAIKPAINWIKAFFTPIQTDGKEAENWGIKFGNGIAWGITKMVEAAKWLKNLITLGGRLKLFPSSGNSENTKVDGSHANGLDNVPYDGYIAKVHKNEAILTANEAGQWRKIKQNKTNNTSVSLNYSPVINLSGAFNEKTKSEFLEMLKKHKNEIYTMLLEVQRRKEVRAYA